MFSKQNKLPAAPKAPTLNQIIEDLETYKEEAPELETVRRLPADSKNIDHSYWRIYQTFLEDSKLQQTTYDTLEQMKYSMQNTVSEVNGAKNQVMADVEQLKKELSKARSTTQSTSSSES